ncbi:MAG: hypothetical protein Q4D26_00495 [Clostridia bacterium]|nr:hypothetical protein [Clostridia bacterium]
MKGKKYIIYCIIFICILGIGTAGICTYNDYSQKKQEEREARNEALKESLAELNKRLEKIDYTKINDKKAEETTGSKKSAGKSAVKNSEKATEKTTTKSNLKTAKKFDNSSEKSNSESSNKKTKSRDQLQKEYDELNENPPELLFVCKSCGGVDYNTCSVCYSGKTINPDFSDELKEWSDKKEEILIQLGWDKDNAEQQCLDEEIAVKEKYNLSDDENNGSPSGGNNIGNSYNYGYDTYGGSLYYSYGSGNINNTTKQKPKEMCTRCYGSGKCHTCNGKGWYRSSLTNDNIACPNCNKTGICAGCNGLGER